MKKTIPAKINEGTEHERIVGVVKDGMFVKYVQRSVHCFIKFDAWGLSAEMFRKYLLPKNIIIKFIDREDGLIYETNARTMEKEGFYFHFSPKNRDKNHRTQILLPRHKWIIKEKNGIGKCPRCGESKLSDVCNTCMYGM